MRKNLLVFIPILILLVFSCQAPNGPEAFTPVEPETEENDTLLIEEEIRTVEAGAFIYADDTVPIEIDQQKLEEGPSRLQIELLTSRGTVAAVQEHIFSAGNSKDPLPDLALPKLEEGQYTLRYLLYDENDEIFYEKLIPFFYILREYAILGIQSFPNAIQPRSAAILQAAVSVPEKTNPYLRWSLGDSVIHEGYYTQGTANFDWISPDIEGVYTISLELFPVMPEGDMVFSSDIAMSTEIYVTSSPALKINELQPETDYYSLYHFRGNTAEAGYRKNGQKAVLIGVPELRVLGETFGYYLDGNSGFMVPAFLLPVEEKRLLPFSVVFRGLFAALQPDTSLFASSTDDGNFSFSISTNHANRLQAVFSSEDKTVYSSLPRGFKDYIHFGSDVFSNLIITAVPETGPAGENRTVFMWYIDNSLVHRETLGFDPFIPDTAGTSMIAGENGMTGILDEFGIYYDTSDEIGGGMQNVYEASLESEYGLDLRFAEGFDALVLPEFLEYTGDVSLQGGAAVLSPGAEITLPGMLLRNEEIDVLIELSSGIDGVSCLLDLLDTGVPQISINGTGTVLIGEEETAVLPISHDHQMKFVLIHNAESIILKIGDEEITLYHEQSGSVNIRLSVLNNDGKDVHLESISIISTSNEIVQKEQTNSIPPLTDMEQSPASTAEDSSVAQNTEDLQDINNIL